MNPVLYLAIYNGSYLVIELIINAITMHTVVKRRLFEIYL
jgi:thiamine transporter ThiT